MTGIEKILLALALMLLPLAAHATAWSEYKNFFTQLHFDETFFGKEVAGVYAHVGVLKLHDNCGTHGVPYWDNVQHVRLEPKDGHFFGKAVLEASMSECMPRVLGVTVQYWVYLKDGSQTITDSALVPVTENRLDYHDYQSRLPEFRKQFSDLQDGDRTQALLISMGYAS